MTNNIEKKVKIDRKVLYEICDAILSHDGYSDEGYDCIYTGHWDDAFLQKVSNIRNNSWAIVMERVKKGERYWYIVCDCDGFDAEEAFDNHLYCDKFLFEIGNYFTSPEEAGAMVHKLRAILKGADVIEMPDTKEANEQRKECLNSVDAGEGFGHAIIGLTTKLYK